MLGIVRTLNFSFSTIGNTLLLYFTLVWSKLEFASPVWNSITATDANNLERVQRKCAVLCFTRSFLTFLKTMLVYLSFWSYIRYKLEGFALMLFVMFFRDLNFFLLWLRIFSLRIPSFSFNKCTKFSIASINCSSSKCATAAYLVCSNTYI
jgi:hypothetical protein